jgi:hypothetical protein
MTGRLRALHGMRPLLVVLAIAGCREPAKPVPRSPGPFAPVVTVDGAPAPRAKSPTEVASPWLVHETAELAAVPLAGSFATLDEVCVALGKKPGESCHIQEGSVEDPTGELLERADLDTDEPLGDAPPDHTQDRRRHLVFRTAEGWFATPWIDGVGGGKSSFDDESEIVDGHLVIRYVLTNATSGEWAGTYEHGIVLCKAGAPFVACTPRIVIGRASYDTKKRDAPGGVEKATLACSATFQAGTLTVAPAKAPKRGSDRMGMQPVYSAAAAAACKKLPYAGARVVKF